MRGGFLDSITPHLISYLIHGGIFTSLNAANESEKLKTQTKTWKLKLFGGTDPLVPLMGSITVSLLKFEPAEVSTNLHLHKNLQEMEL